MICAWITDRSGDRQGLPGAAAGVTACLGNLILGWRLGTPTDEAASVFEEGRRLAEEIGRGELDRAEHEAQAAVTVAHAQHSRCDELGAHLALTHTPFRRADAAALARAEQALLRA